MTRPAPPPDDEPDHLDQLLRELRAPAVHAGAEGTAVAGRGPGAPASGRLAARGLDRDQIEGGRHRPGHVPLVSIPASLRGMDLTVRSRAVRGLLAVAVVVVVVLGGRWAWASLDASPTADGEVVTPTGAHAGRSVGPSPATAPTAGSAAAAHPPPSGGDTAVASAAAAPGVVDAAQGTTVLLLVHVAGQVGNPGVVELPAGSRVVDAVAAAGGFTRDADQAALNLARPVIDGEQVWVGRPGESPPVQPPVGMPPPGPVPVGTLGPGQGGGDAGGALLDLNTATQADLEELPGVGPVTAGQILAWRDAHGRFSRVDELLEVSGIGERTLERLEPLVTVGG